MSLRGFSPGRRWMGIMRWEQKRSWGMVLGKREGKEGNLAVRWCGVHYRMEFRLAVA